MLATILFLGRDNIALLAKNDDVINPVAGLFHLITHKRSTSLPIMSFPAFFSGCFLSPQQVTARGKSRKTSCSRKFDYANVV